MFYLRNSLLILVLIFTQNSVAENPFNSYCKDGKQIKKLSEKVTILLPRPPSGVPLDIVQKQQKQYRANARKLMKEVFLYKFNEYGQPTTWENNDLSKNLEFYQNDEKIELNWVNLKSLKALSDLYDRYTFRIPKENQNKLFSSGKVPRRYFSKQCITANSLYGHVGYFGLDESCSFSASLMIKDGARAWEALKYEYTSVKESPGENARELKFEIDLDLSLLCKYGIRIKDLYSK